MRPISSVLFLMLCACGVTDFVFDQTAELINEEPRFVVARLNPSDRLFYPRETQLEAYVVTRDGRGLKFQEVHTPLRNAQIHDLQMSPDARSVAVQYDTITARNEFVVEIHDIDTGRLELRHEFNTLSEDVETFCTTDRELRRVAPIWSDIIEDGRAVAGSMPNIRHYDPIDVLDFAHWTTANEATLLVHSKVGIVQTLPSGEERPWNAARNQAFYIILEKSREPANWRVTGCSDRRSTTAAPAAQVHRVNTSNVILLDGAFLNGLDDQPISGLFANPNGSTDAWRPQ